MRRFLGFLVPIVLVAAALTPATATLPGVRLSGLVPSWAVPSARLGPVRPGSVVEIWLTLPWRNPAAVTELVRAVSDPASPRYRHYLTSQQFRARYAPSRSTVAAAVSWLRAQGLEVGQMPLNRVIVPARGPAHLVQKAFGVTLSRYSVGAFGLRAPDGPPLLPAALARLGILVRGLDQSMALLTPGERLTPQMFMDPAAIASDPPPRIPQTPPNPADATPPAAVLYPRPCSAHDGATTDPKAPLLDGKRHPAVQCATSVAALRAAYGVDQMIKRKIDGAGETIVMIGSHALRNLPADLAEWSKRRGLPALKEGQISQFSYPGAYETPADPTQSVLRPQVWMQQSAMLFQTMRAIAPGANYLYVGSTSSLDLPNALLLAVDRHLGEVIVNGWYSASESLVLPSDTAPIDRAAEQAAATGISLLVASGDLGDNSAFNATQTDEQPIGPQPVGPVTVPRLATVPNVPIIPAHPSVSFPAHNPMVTAVGATSLLLGKNGKYLRELGWAKTTRTFADGKWQNPNPGAYRGSGGGTSQIYRQPDYQVPVVPLSLAQRPYGGILGRTVPDIAVNGDAETGMLIGYTMLFPDGSKKYAERRINADTASTALFGALLALANQQERQALGFVNPLLYRVSTSGRSEQAFRDITLAGNEKAGIRTDYVSGVSGPTKRVLKTFEQFGTNPPRPGYDTNTGIGSPSQAFFRLLAKGAGLAAQQIINGSVLSTAAGGGAARTAFATSGGAVNGVAGYVFAVDAATVGTRFILRLTKTTGFDQANITFYNAAGTACLSYTFNNPEEGGRVCGVQAVVWLFHGTAIKFEYRAGRGTDYGVVADRTTNMTPAGRVGFTTGTDLAFEGNYAYVGSEDPSPKEGGLHVIDISNPKAPVEVGFLGCPAQQNDVAVWRGIVVMAIDSPSTNNVCKPGLGKEGVRIVDARNPAAPKQIAFIADTNPSGLAGESTSGAHTITSVGDTGYVYINNNAGSTVDVLNLKPALVGKTPSIAGRISVSASSEDGCHDITAEGTRAFCAAGAHTDIWDITNPLAPVVLGRIVNPLIDFHHSTAVDGNTLIISDEFTGAFAAAGCGASDQGPLGALWFYDISNPALPVMLGWIAPPEISPGIRCTAHNLNVIPGRKMLVAAWYRMGTRVIDFSNPSRPVEVGHARGEGAVTWSSYWYRGRIYTGDMHRGFEAFSFTG